MDKKLPRIEPGGLLKDYHINDPNEALDRLYINPGPGIGKAEGPNGTTLWTYETVEFWAKITSGGGGSGGSSGAYAWTEQVPAAGGTFVAGFRKGTTTVLPAYESTGNTAVPANKIVWMRYDEASNSYVFTFRKCS